MLKGKDPIIVPSNLWTKELILEQITDENGNELQLNADDVSDEAAMEWVENEWHIREQAISYGEDFYGREVQKLNQTLLESMD